jgi:Restriction endonuclease S subunits
MSEWKKTTLREVIQINPATVDRDFKSEWIEYIDISSVGEGVITESPKVIKLKEAPSRAKRLVSKNDTVISTVRPNRRSMFFVREPKQNWVLSTGFAVLRPIPDKIEPRFLYAVVFNREFTEYLISREKGAAYPAVLPEDIYEAEILLPPLSEQKAIAHILGSLDDKIELNRRMNETLEAMARAIFKDWFVDFGPTRAKIEGRAPYLPEPIWSLFPDAIDPESGLPIGWEAKEIAEFIELLDHKRVPLSKLDREKHRGEYPYYGATGIIDYIDDYLFDEILLLLGEDGSVKKEDGSPFTQYVWGKIWVTVFSGILGYGGVVHTLMGRIRFVPCNQQKDCNNHAHVIKGKNISVEQIKIFFDLCDVSPFVTGAVQLTINQSNLKRIKFTFGGKSIHNFLDQIISPLFENIRLQVDQSRTLAELRDRLLPKLMSGEIRVKDAEKLVMGVVNQQPSKSALIQVLQSAVRASGGGDSAKPTLGER